MRVSSSSAVAPADSVVTSVAARRSTVVNVIRHARRQIDLSLFRCNDREIFSELARATARGVRVDVLVTPRARGGAKKLERLWSALQQTGASLHVYADPLVKYHAKYLVADDGPALVASFNYTRKCFERTCDACVLTHDSEVVSGLRALIAADREGRGMPSDLTPRLIVGPERSRWQLTSLIKHAQSSLRILDAKLSDPDLVRLLNARRADGVAVEVYGSKRLGTLKSHGKILLIDDRIAVIGSLALAPISLDFRREVAIIVNEPEAVADVARLFRTIRLFRTEQRRPVAGSNIDALASRLAPAAARLEASC